MILFAVHFSETITLGSVLLGILLGGAGLATFGYGVKWKSAYDTAEANAKASAEGREVFKQRSERLDGELLECKKQLATLEATRSLEPVLKAILAGFTQMEERFSEHEQRALERHETNQRQGKAHLKILELIAEKLGPENG